MNNPAMEWMLSLRVEQEEMFEEGEQNFEEEGRPFVLGEGAPPRLMVKFVAPWTQQFEVLRPDDIGCRG